MCFFSNRHANKPDTINFCSLVILHCWPSPWYLNFFLQTVLQELMVSPHWNRKLKPSAFFLPWLTHLGPVWLGLILFGCIQAIRSRGAERLPVLVLWFVAVRFVKPHLCAESGGSWWSAPQLSTGPTGVGLILVWAGGSLCILWQPSVFDTGHVHLCMLQAHLLKKKKKGEDWDNDLS